MNLLKFFLIIVFSVLVQAETINIDKHTKQLNILSSSEIYIDYSQKLKIEDVLKKDNLFKKNKKDLLAFGYDPKLNVWIKFTLTNESFEKVSKIIEYSNSLTTHVEFYSPDNEYSKPIIEGLFNIKKDRKTIKPTFSIHLDEYESKTFYIKATSRITTLIVKATLYDSDSFYYDELLHQSILSLFFGAMLILAFYNIFIYFFTKDISYLFYVLYIFAISLHHTIYTGISNIYFSQEVILKIVEHSYVLVAVPIFALGLFTKFFLQISQLKKLNFVLNIFLFLIPASLVFFALTDEFDRYRNILTLTLMIYLVYLTVFCAFKKNRQAYFILFGWFLIFIAVLFMVLSSLGVFYIYKYFPYYVEASLLLEAVVFSIALADRINRLQKEKNEVDRKLLIREQNETQRLTKKVDERTKKLKNALDEKNLLLKELHHRVKNNMQTIVSLIRLQSDEIEDLKLIEILDTIQNRINAMSHLHELLYKQNNLSHINTYEYVEILIEDIRDSFDDEDVIIHLDIQSDLKIESAIYCGLILNELITNAFKHAFITDEGNIYVSLEKKENKLILIVKDDGVGYKRIKNPNSLGLILIETLTINQLKGKLHIDSDNGVTVKIEWLEDG